MLAARQHGVVSRKQMRFLGMTDDMIGTSTAPPLPSSATAGATANRCGRVTRCCGSPAARRTEKRRRSPPPLPPAGPNYEYASHISR